MNKLQYKKLLNIKFDNNINIFWIYDKNNETVFLNIEGFLGRLNLIIPKITKLAFSKQFIYLTSVKKQYFNISKTLLKIIISNIRGVNNLYQINLILSGVGYKVSFNKKTSNLNFYLGYSHKIIVNIPNLIKVEIKNQGTTLILKSINKMELGKVAARIMKLKSIDYYKGKGIININNPITLKQGKTKSS